MATSLEQTLEDTINDIQNLNPQKMSTLIDETIRTMSDLEKKMKSENPEDRKEALERVEQLKVAFEEQTRLVCERAGVDPMKFTVFAEEMMTTAPKAPQGKKKYASPKLHKGLKG